MGIERERVREGEVMGEHSRGEERLSMMKARFLGQVVGEKGNREASRH